MICKNCESNFDSKFCPACGQKADTHRITVGHVVHDLIHAFTHADKGFFLLSKSLLTKPGYVAKEFISGKHKKYYNPLSFLVITSAILAYISFQTGYMDAVTGGSQNTGGRPMPEVMKETFRIGSNTGKWLSLFLITPVYAFLTWIFFIRRKYNYAENFVLNCFLFGEAAIFRILVMVPLFLMMPEMASKLNWFIYEPAFLIYTIIAYRQFFGENYFLIILKAVLTRALFIVLFWTLIFAFVYVKHLIL